ncbi:hypothetical protein [Psychrobium sp. 1_MG-2023]|uniref:hypothetical protein n=1 Tax=Psychrobium sp. 1_MG-2023 TaxID=3062624 RepID=UPI0012920CF7|nr:hypothetical protein [Psychrobium sp. 1_MG-2023]MDP2561234.1 hypothetical protein [Psychrobium sp. 1_MG-2023]
MISIVLQSFNIVVDSGAAHQLDTAHLATEHNHATHQSEFVDLPASHASGSTEQHDSSDCHHCGHCSGSHLTWVTSKAIARFNPLLTPEIYPNPTFYLSSLSETAFRPPIV